jgi:hypothetical protein
MIIESWLLTRFTFVSCALSTSVTYTPKFSASHQRLRLPRPWVLTVIFTLAFLARNHQHDWQHPRFCN